MASRKFDRKPSPPDDRDYPLRDYIDRAEHAPPAPDEYADKTIREIAHEGISWSFWLSLWQLVKKLIHAEPPPPEPPPPPVVGSVVWQDPDQLDQEKTGHCVGFGCTDFCNCSPINDHLDNAWAHALYYAAKTIELGHAVPVYDPPGSGPADVENGAYTRDGLKALAKAGRITTYARAHSAEDMIAWIRQSGPLVVGTSWLAGMEDPDVHGIVRATGQDLGGHCYLVDGWIPVGSTTPEGYEAGVDLFACQNSWGRDWGKAGSFYISTADFAVLLHNDGEAWAAVELPL